VSGGQAGPTEDRKAVDWLLAHCLEKLTPWERGFVQNLATGPCAALTPKQREKLNKIWREAVEGERPVWAEDDAWAEW